MGRLARGLGALALGLGSSISAVAQEYNEAEESFSNPELGDVAPSRPTSIPGPLTVYGGVRIGAGGEADYDQGASDELIATLGLQAGADYVIMDYFALGGELRLASFNTDINDDFGNGRSILFDFVVRPRGRYAFSGMPLELFATLPLGLTIPSINDDWNAEGNAGFTLGFGSGANYFLTDRIGLGAELLYLAHWISWDSNVVSGTVTNTDISVVLGQFNFVANAIYAF